MLSHLTLAIRSQYTEHLISLMDCIYKFLEKILIWPVTFLVTFTGMSCGHWSNWGRLLLIILSHVLRESKSSILWGWFCIVFVTLGTELHLEMCWNPQEINPHVVSKSWVNLIINSEQAPDVFSHTAHVTLRVRSSAARNYQAGHPRSISIHCKCENKVFYSNNTDRCLLRAFCLIAMYSVDVVA